MRTNNIYIIHGYTASSKSNWFPWIKEQLETKGIKTYIPNLPNSHNPYLSEWIQYLTETASDIDENTIFVGHSLGCITCIRFLLNKNIKIKGAIFVSGFIDENPMDDKLEGLQSFVSDDINIEKLKDLVPIRIAITSTNDDIVPSDATKKMALRIDAKLIELDYGKHFIDRDGYTKFPILLNEIEKLVNNN